MSLPRRDQRTAETLRDAYNDFGAIRIGLFGPIMLTLTFLFLEACATEELSLE